MIIYHGSTILNNYTHNMLHIACIIYAYWCLASKIKYVIRNMQHIWLP